MEGARRPKPAALFDPADPRWRAVRQWQSTMPPTTLQAGVKLAWLSLYFLSGMRLGLVVFKASDLAENETVNSKGGRDRLAALIAAGLLTVLEHDTRTGVYKCVLNDPLELAQVRVARGDAQALLPVMTEEDASDATALGEWDPTVSLLIGAAKEAAPSADTGPPGGSEATGKSGATSPRQGENAFVDNNQTLLKRRAAKEHSNLPSNFQSAKRSASASGGARIVRGGEVASDFPQGNSPPSEPKPIGALVDEVLAAELGRSEGDRARRRDDMAARIVSRVSDPKLSPVKVRRLVDLVLGGTFPQWRMEGCLDSLDRKRADTEDPLRAEPGWYFWWSIDRSGRQMCVDLKFATCRKRGR
jgi:hypothetical protein